MLDKALRKLAIQLAAQLPDDASDARYTLELTREIVDKFLDNANGRAAAADEIRTPVAQ